MQHRDLVLRQVVVVLAVFSAYDALIGIPLEALGDRRVRAGGCVLDRVSLLLLRVLGSRGASVISVSAREMAGLRVDDRTGAAER